MHRGKGCMLGWGGVQQAGKNPRMRARRHPVGKTVLSRTPTGNWGGEREKGRVCGWAGEESGEEGLCEPLTLVL